MATLGLTLFFVLVCVFYVHGSSALEGSHENSSCCGSGSCPRFEHDFHVLKKLAEIEVSYTSMQNTIQEQQRLISELQKKQFDSLSSQWGSWTAWGNCFTSNCSNSNGGRVQTRSRKANVNGEMQTEEESRFCNAVLFQGCSKQPGGDDNFAVSYDFRDQIAVSTCTALHSGGRYVYAVRRACSDLTVSCEVICKNIQSTCFNALQVFVGGVLQRGETGKAGLHVFRYNNCNGTFCGPNFCCCA